MNDRIAIMIRGLGSYLPQRVMTNADFEEFLDTSDEWIITRTGIRERRIADDDENTLTMAVEASKRALDDAGLIPQDLDLIVVATTTPYVPLPATACYLQKELGCGHTAAFDVQAACSGFVYALVNGACLMSSGQYRHALIVGTEKMSAVTDFKDRTVCILLGDAAGATIISPADNGVSGIYDYCLGADGSGAPMLWIPAGGSLTPATTDTVNGRLHYLKMNGREVYKFAVVKMQEVISDTIARAGLSVDDLALIVPHQSNQRMIESAGQKLGIPLSKFALNIDHCGNTSAASIPVALDEAYREGRIKSGDWILLAGFGAGYTWASALLRL
ncbi:MAG: ketoacyl-ACP synthase III [Planctomycetota bacterium]|nr:MAG: ketoacyl-ACP synthase III [Planctomycetota bacterium]